jgi:hypothetical protein
MNCRSLIGLAVMFCVLAGADARAEDAGQAPEFNDIYMIVIRSPDPTKLSEFYAALGMKIKEVAENGAVFFDIGSERTLFEILNMEENTKPSGPKTTRTQEGLVALIETTNLKELMRRAKEAGSPMVEPLGGDADSARVVYIADWENNIVGFTVPRS